MLQFGSGICSDFRIRDFRDDEIITQDIVYYCCNICLTNFPAILGVTKLCIGLGIWSVNCMSLSSQHCLRLGHLCSKNVQFKSQQKVKTSIFMRMKTPAVVFCLLLSIVLASIPRYVGVTCLHASFVSKRYFFRFIFIFFILMTLQGTRVKGSWTSKRLTGWDKQKRNPTQTNFVVA